VVTEDHIGEAIATTPNSAAMEPHITPRQIAEKWGISVDVARRLFEREPGVLVISESSPRGKRRYRTLRIPLSVAERVHRRLTNV
jgi:hypothetical protein